jgi:hypothetical protein
LNIVVHPADIQNRDGAFHLLCRARRLFRSSNAFLLTVHAGRKMAMTVRHWCLELANRQAIGRWIWGAA